MRHKTIIDQSSVAFVGCRRHHIISTSTVSHDVCPPPKGCNSPYPHFIGEEMEAQRLSNSPIVILGVPGCWVACCWCSAGSPPAEAEWDVSSPRWAV